MKVFLEKSPLSVLPPSQGASVNTTLEGELILANTQCPAQLGDSFPKAAASIRERRVPEEFNDLRDKVKLWGGAPFLPVGHRVCFNTESVGHFLLQEAPAKALLAEMVSDGPQFPWIGRWERS